MRLGSGHLAHRTAAQIRPRLNFNHNRIVIRRPPQDGVGRYLAVEGHGIPLADSLLKAVRKFEYESMGAGHWLCVFCSVQWRSGRIGIGEAGCKVGFKKMYRSMMVGIPTDVQMQEKITFL